ncbi:DinI family protein [Yersinia frederiksenii]|uniref:DinI family protein n=1 Tax=Yersinia frederiksenii TaxID=29484 RepID=A0AAI8ZQK3_YERFR|nr:DinI family protein [Yersinia frederiksenii]
MLRIEVTVDKAKKLPAGALSALAIEFNDRVKRRYPDAEATIRLASMDGLSVLSGLPHDKEVIQEILQETWESADDWFQA